MKKLFFILSLTFALIFGINNAAEKASTNKTIIVGSTPTPHAEILRFAKDVLKKQGWNLEVKEFNDYMLPNLALNDGELDANLYQHKPFLEDFNKNKMGTLISLDKIELVPMAIYSNKIKDIKNVPNGAKIAIPNDSTNESRALDLLAKTGYITFKDNANTLKTPLDIDKNPKNFKFIELKSPQLPRALNDADLAIITTNYALGAGLNPKKDGIFMEDKDNPYAAIVLATKKGNENSEKIKALREALKSKEVKEFMEKTFKGAVIPAF